MSRESFADVQVRVLERYGVNARSEMVSTRSGPVHVLSAGTGPSVLFLHGLGAFAASWAPLLPALSDFTVYAVDLPGHGLTPRPARVIGTNSMRATATGFLLELLHGLALQGPVTVVANSLGSLWSTWLAIEHPQRVRALSHIGSPALILGASAPLLMRLGATGGIGPRLLKLRRPSRRQMYGVAAVLGDDLTAHPALAELLVAQDGVPGYLETVRDLSFSLVRARGARPELALGEEELRSVVHPVQLIWGEHDPLGPLDLAYACFAALRNGDLSVVEGGHVPWLTSVSAVTRELRRFLER